ncbi:hypothetical protein QZH41_001968, partial [Actinostola sp. cb2023]
MLDYREFLACIETKLVPMQESATAERGLWKSLDYIIDHYGLGYPIDHYGLADYPIDHYGLGYPIDRCGLGYPIDRCGLGYPIDRYGLGYPIDRCGLGYPIDHYGLGYPIDRCGLCYPIDHYGLGYPIERYGLGYPIDRCGLGYPIDRYGLGYPIDHYGLGYPIDRCGLGYPIERCGLGYPITKRFSWLLRATSRICETQLKTGRAETLRTPDQRILMKSTRGTLDMPLTDNKYDIVRASRTHGEIICPECREIVKINPGATNQFKVNFQMNNLLSLLAINSPEGPEDAAAKTKLSCENCSTDEAVKGRCIDC